MRTIFKTPADCESANHGAATASCRPSLIGKTTIVVFLLGILAVVSCSSLDRELQGGIEAMADTIETSLDPALPASFQTAAKRQARETVKYAETNDPLLRRNVREMLDTIENDLDPAMPADDRRRILEHARAVKDWVETDKRPAYFENSAETESVNEP